MITQTQATVTTAPANRPTLRQGSGCTVTAAVNLRADSGLIIPAGTPGRILEVNRHSLAFVDFGAAAVYSLPLGSPLVKWGKVGGDG